MIPPLQHLRAWLDAFQPGTFNASLAALLWGALWLVRKKWPLFFAKLPSQLQAWPALAMGAVVAALSASTDGNIGQAVLNALGMAFTGLLSGAMSVGVHRVLKESPLPYGTNDIPPKPPTTPLVAILCLVFIGCTPAARAGIPVLSTVDAIGMGVAQVAGWCEDRGVEPETVASAKRLADSKDYQGALALLADVVSKARAAGDPVPADVEVTLRLAEGAAAAYAVEQGMRAISAPTPAPADSAKALP